MTRLRLCLAALAALALAGGAVALDLPPNARLAAERNSPFDRYAAPVAAFDGAVVPALLMEGRITRQAWQIPVGGLTAAQIAAPLREQLVTLGYTIRLDCASEQCGGFDFRFGLEVLPAPAMFVNLRSYVFITAVLGPPDSPERVVTILASAAREAAYVQIVEANSDVNAPPLVAVDANEGPRRAREVPEAPEVPIQAAAGLFATGAEVLEDLEFDTGATSLGAGPFPALLEIVAYLQANPQARLVLVGHTDTVGSLEQNIEISRERARSVRLRLIEVYGIAAERLDAEGVGYLAPRATNETAAGREANRRVEAILLDAP